MVYGLKDGCCVVRHKSNMNLVAHLCQSSWVTRCIIKEQSTLKGIFPSEQQVSGIKLFSKLPGASVRNSSHGKGREEGGSAYAKAGLSLRSPPGNSRASTRKPESAYFLLCAFTYTSDFTGGCPPLPLSEKRVSLQLQLIIPGCDSV